LARFFEADLDHAGETDDCNSKYNPVGDHELENIWEIDIHVFGSFQVFMNEMRQIREKPVINFKITLCRS